MKMRWAAALLAVAAGPALAGDIVRCTARDGSVIYQDTPCGGSGREHALDIPSDFPPPNSAERARLLAREAAMDQRLEAQRERDAKESALREARAEREAAERARLAALAAAREAQEPQFILLYPPRRPPHHRPRLQQPPFRTSGLR